MFTLPNLDPEDWNEFSALAADFIQLEIAELQKTIEAEVWQEVPIETKQALEQEQLPTTGSTIESVIEQYQNLIRPYRTGNTHPKFWGWVHGSGNVAALLADVAISAMNSNCGGRDHGAVYVERQVMNWCKQIFDFNLNAAGILTSGTSQSSFMALEIALYKKLGDDVKTKGLASVGKTVRFYTSIETHSSVKKAIEALGVGSDNLVAINTDEQHSILLSDLRQKIEKDCAEGYTPTAIIANAGTVNTGSFDDLIAIKKICSEFDCWMHVDGAFGAWLKLTEKNEYKQLLAGIELADSLAFDFHKFMSIQYDCAGLLVQDTALQQQVFSSRPDYLAPHGEALAGGDPWYCDFGLELSRPFRALKVWFTIKTYGVEKLGSVIQNSCECAVHLAKLVNQSEQFECYMQPKSNVLCFKRHVSLNAIQNNGQCEQIVAELQQKGDAVFSLTRFSEYRYIRAAFVNQRTTVQHVDEVFQQLQRLVNEM